MVDITYIKTNRSFDPPVISYNNGIVNLSPASFYSDCAYVGNVTRTHGGTSILPTNLYFVGNVSSL